MTRGLNYGPLIVALAKAMVDLLAARCLGFVLVVVGAAKVLLPEDPAKLGYSGLLWLIGFVEVLAGACLLGCRSRSVRARIATVVWVVALAALIYTVISPGTEGSCGCVGRLRLTLFERRALIVGVAVLALLARRRRVEEGREATVGRSRTVS